MNSFDLSDLSSQQIEELVDALNSDGILHALSGSTLKISEEDFEAVSMALLIMRRHFRDQPRVEGTGSELLRYDISEFHPYELAALKRNLSSTSIDFEIAEGVLSVPRSCESQVDIAIHESEEALRVLEAAQSTSREIQTGRQAPSCEICGRTPAAPIDLRRQVGMVVVMKTYRAEMTLCESCAAEVYKHFQKSTAIKGWTGVRSALMNPIVLGTNAVNRNKHRRKLEGGS
jgi:hypothetical protein